MQGQRKIPTLLAIVLLVVSMVVVGYIFEFITRQDTKASVSIEPKEVTITNLTDTSFTITWQTDDLTSGTALVSSQTGKKYSAFDERDITGKISKYLTHSITVRTLQPSTSYEVTLLSDGKKFPRDAKGYQVTTLPTLSSQSVGYDPSYGSILLTGGKPAEGTLVYLTLNDSQTVSTLVRNSGSWIIPLSSLRTQDGASYVPIVERASISIIAKLGSTQSRVMTDTLNDSPVPDIVLGETYDFRGRDAKKPTQPNIAQTTQTTTTPAKNAVLGATTGGIALTGPLQGAQLTSNRPLITGIGIPGKSVTITIGISEPIVGSTTIAVDGSWRYTPKSALMPGKQSVTMTTVDGKNKPIAITHTFTILKSGSQVLGDATPSAVLEATPSPTLVSTEAATLAGEEMPTSGSFLPTMLLIVLGLSLFIGGGSIVFIRR